MEKRFYWIYVTVFINIVAGSALMRPSTNALLSKRTIKGQGTTMGLAFSFESSGRIVEPLALGFVITSFGVSIPFYVTAVVLLFAAYLFYKYEVKRI